MSDVKKQVVNELFKPLRKKFLRRRTIQRGINDLWQADLTILDKLKKDNDDYKYLLCVIDIFTRKVWVEPLFTKTGKEVSVAFQKILNKSKDKPNFIQTDEGNEFFNSYCKNLFLKYNIKHYHSFTKIKCAFIERWQRTFKTIMWKFFAYNGTYRYIDDLQKLVNEYNNRPHRGLNFMTPNSITKRKEKMLLKKIYNHPKAFKYGKLKLNDFVRLADYSGGPFMKGYESNYSTNIFQIKKVRLTNPVTYRIEDSTTKKLLDQSFYEPELQKVKYPNVYLIEKVIKEKGDKLFVKYLGFDKKYNEWINKSDVV